MRHEMLVGGVLGDTPGFPWPWPIRITNSSWLNLPLAWVETIWSANNFYLIFFSLCLGGNLIWGPCPSKREMPGAFGRANKLRRINRLSRTKGQTLMPEIRANEKNKIECSEKYRKTKAIFPYPHPRELVPPFDFSHIFVRNQTFIALAVVVNGQLYGIVILMFSGCRNKIKGFPPTEAKRKTKTNKTKWGWAMGKSPM